MEKYSEYIRECCSEALSACVGGGGIDRYIKWALFESVRLIRRLMSELRW